MIPQSIPMHETDHSPSSSFLLSQMLILLFACAALTLPFFLEVQAEEQIAFRFGSESPWPQVCGSRAWFGFKCPACGLTRSFVELAEGSLAASLAQHRLGIMIAVVVALQIPYRLMALKTGREHPWGDRVASCGFWGVMLLLIANWLIGFAID